MINPERFNPFSRETAEEEEGKEEEGAIKKEKYKEELEMQDVRKQVKEDFKENVENWDRLSEKEKKIMQKSGDHLIDKFTSKEGEEINREESIKRFGESFRKGVLNKRSFEGAEGKFNSDVADKAEGYYKGKFIRALSNPKKASHNVFSQLGKVAALESRVGTSDYESASEMIQENKDEPGAERKMKKLVKENLDLIHYRMGVDKERAKEKELEKIEEHPDKEKAAEVSSSPDSMSGSRFKKKLREMGFEIKRKEEVHLKNKEGVSKTETTNEILAKEDERAGALEVQFNFGREAIEEIEQQEE